MNNPIPQCSPDSPEWVFQTVEMINELQRRSDNLAVEHTTLLTKYNALCEAVHKAMGRTAACDKKQTKDQLIADVAYLKRLASDRYKERT